MVPVTVVGGEAERTRVLEERQDHYGDNAKAGQPLDRARVVQAIDAEGSLVGLVMNCTVVEGILYKDGALKYRSAVFFRQGIRQ